jgi:hypothetical protein
VLDAALDFNGTTVLLTASSPLVAAAVTADRIRAGERWLWVEPHAAGRSMSFAAFAGALTPDSTPETMARICRIASWHGVCGDKPKALHKLPDFLAAARAAVAANAGADDRWIADKVLECHCTRPQCKRCAARVRLSVALEVRTSGVAAGATAFAQLPQQRNVSETLIHQCLRREHIVVKQFASLVQLAQSERAPAQAVARPRLNMLQMPMSALGPLVKPADLPKKELSPEQLKKDKAAAKLAVKSIQPTEQQSAARISASSYEEVQPSLAADRAFSKGAELLRATVADRRAAKRTVPLPIDAAAVTWSLIVVGGANVIGTKETPTRVRLSATIGDNVVDIARLSCRVAAFRTRGAVGSVPFSVRDQTGFDGVERVDGTLLFVGMLPPGSWQLRAYVDGVRSGAHEFHVLLAGAFGPTLERREPPHVVSLEDVRPSMPADAAVSVRWSGELTKLLAAHASAVKKKLPNVGSVVIDGTPNPTIAAAVFFGNTEVTADCTLAIKLYVVLADKDNTRMELPLVANAAAKKNQPNSSTSNWRLGGLSKDARNRLQTARCVQFQLMSKSVDEADLELDMRSVMGNP